MAGAWAASGCARHGSPSSITAEATPITRTIKVAIVADAPSTIVVHIEAFDFAFAVQAGSGPLGRIGNFSDPTADRTDVDENEMV
ncbi:MAG: hypothetical protein N2B03_00110 [Boseongicola sp.]